jgi:hypothetical protein
MSKGATQGVVRRNTIGEGKELLEPRRLGLAVLLHVFPALRPPDDRTQGLALQGIYGRWRRSMKAVCIPAALAPIQSKL